MINFMKQFIICYKSTCESSILLLTCVLESFNTAIDCFHLTCSATAGTGNVCCLQKQELCVAQPLWRVRLYTICACFSLGDFIVGKNSLCCLMFFVNQPLHLQWRKPGDGGDGPRGSVLHTIQDHKEGGRNRENWFGLRNTQLDQLSFKVFLWTWNWIYLGISLALSGSNDFVQKLNSLWTSGQHAPF